MCAHSDNINPGCLMMLLEGPWVKVRCWPTETTASLQIEFSKAHFGAERPVCGLGCHKASSWLGNPAKTRAKTGVSVNMCMVLQLLRHKQQRQEQWSASGVGHNRRAGEAHRAGGQALVQHFLSLGGDLLLRHKQQNPKHWSAFGLGHNRWAGEAHRAGGQVLAQHFLSLGGDLLLRHKQLMLPPPPPKKRGQQEVHLAALTPAGCHDLQPPSSITP